MKRIYKNINYFGEWRSLITIFDTLEELRNSAIKFNQEAEPDEMLIPSPEKVYGYFLGNDIRSHINFSKETSIGNISHEVTHFIQYIFTQKEYNPLDMNLINVDDRSAFPFEDFARLQGEMLEYILEKMGIQ